MLIISDIIIAVYLTLYLSIFLVANLNSTFFSAFVFTFFFTRFFSLFCFIKLIACDQAAFLIGIIDDIYAVATTIIIALKIVLSGIAKIICWFTSNMPIS